jgi:hypothetical protein
MARDIYQDSDAADAEQPREGLGSALVILTTVLLIGALIVMETARKKHFNEGLFGGKPEATTTN